MEINLGKLLDTEVHMITEPQNSVVARVKWILEKGEIKWGTILRSKTEGEYWAQMPHFPFAKGRNGWTWPLIITDKEVENELFNAALKIFTGLLSSGENQMVTQTSDELEEINLDGIPFD